MNKVKVHTNKEEAIKEAKQLVEGVLPGMRKHYNLLVEGGKRSDVAVEEVVSKFLKVGEKGVQAGALNQAGFDVVKEILTSIEHKNRIKGE